ncbi:HYC_CC_PP family protein [Pedobacter sp. PWIIR3]
MKLQQKIAAALCAFYLISMIGLAINMHFCGGKLSSVKIDKVATCPACKEDKKVTKEHDCCKTRSVEAKIKDSHQAGVKVKLPADFSLQLFLGQHFSSLANKAVASLPARGFNKAPPLSAILSLHIFNCIFRN